MGALENWIVFALSNQQQAEEAKKRGDLLAAKQHAEYASVGQSWALGYMNTPDGPSDLQKIVPTVTTAIGAAVGGPIGAAVGSAAGNYMIGETDPDKLWKSAAVAAGASAVGGEILGATAAPLAAGAATYALKAGEQPGGVQPTATAAIASELINPDQAAINAKRRAERLAMGRQGSIKTSSLGLPGGGATFAGKQLLGS